MMNIPKDKASSLKSALFGVTFWVTRGIPSLKILNTFH